MIKGLILALQFFTRIPINIPVDFKANNIKYSIFFMPLIGALIGVVGSVFYYIFAPYNKIIASFLVLLVTIILTGGLHLDGLVDTFDGFMANKNKEDTLIIMKDSRVGAFGALSLNLILLFKFILIISIENLPVVLILAYANSRLVTGIIISYKKMAKPGGLGNLFSSSNPKGIVILSGVLYLGILMVIDIKYIIPLVMNLIGAEYISYISYKKIGGLTGDLYGAIIEIGDVISLFTFWSVMMWT